MGNEQSVDLRESLEHHAVLKQFTAETQFVSSGRLMRTYKVKHHPTEISALVKGTCLQADHDVSEHVQELKRIKEACRTIPHVAAFQAWFVGGECRSGGRIVPGLKSIYLLRPFVYTTLSDRLASRPWLHVAEKCWITSQLLQAVQALHDAEIVHGFLTTENVGLTSTGWVVLLDISSYKALTQLPDNDPSEFLYYFGSAKRCYLAPERFCSQTQESKAVKLTPAMDIFSLGCVLTELFLNGERCLDLGDLMEYRKHQTLTGIQQKLNKIESSSIRAACKHMLHLKPEERLEAAVYWDRLKAADQFPVCFERITEIIQNMTTKEITSDARIAVAASEYGKVLWEIVGMADQTGVSYFEKVLGPGFANSSSYEALSHTRIESKAVGSIDLFSETELLLEQLESLKLGSDDRIGSTTEIDDEQVASQASNFEPITENRSELSKSALLIFLQAILSTMKHTQRPASKLVGLQLVDRLARFSSDEARLQRIVPVTVSLLNDQDPLVRASSVQVLSNTLSIIETFSPSDSKVFPQYVFKRVAHLISDQSLIVRFTFARCVATLAETSRRFADISHAVRLYEAIGSGSTATPEETDKGGVFGDEIARLLDCKSESGDNVEKRSDAGKDESCPNITNNVLINNTYSAELAVLHEVISRWVVHIALDQSEHSSMPKRAILHDLNKLCSFFGVDGVMAFILPQILAFLNDRRDWELRASLFAHLPIVCQVIGRGSTEEYVLPCIETGLVDSEERVVYCSLICLAQIIDMGLLSRSSLVGNPRSHSNDPFEDSILYKYGSLLAHPSYDIRHGATEMFAAASRVIGTPDFEVCVAPVLRPYTRHEAIFRRCITGSEIEKCLLPPLTRVHFARMLDKMVFSHQHRPLGGGNWTNIGITADDSNVSIDGGMTALKHDEARVSGSQSSKPQEDGSLQYLRLLARHSVQASNLDRSSEKSSHDLSRGIEGSTKLAQNVMFPKQGSRVKRGFLPEWYASLRDQDEAINVNPTVAIRSVSSLGSVYGLSIMDTAEVSSEAGTECDEVSYSNAINLDSNESRRIQAAFEGQWGPESSMDPDIVDTSLLLTKLNALGVPPLPPKLGEQSALPFPLSRQVVGTIASKDNGQTHGWKPKMSTMIASSLPICGHTAPVMRLAVAMDNSFFVSGSHDGTCRVWEIPDLDESDGVLESTHTYSCHLDGGSARVNDIAMLEGTHSIVSGDSDGNIHVWRVDLISSSPKKTSAAAELRQRHDRPRVVGTSLIRKIDPLEGEILAVSHYNSHCASVVTFASQKGVVHSWDLRSAREPFTLRHSPVLGYLSSIAYGSDRSWIVTGTSKGYVALWDIRYQQAVHLWRHSRGSSIARLATSFIPPPQKWGQRGSFEEYRPYIFVSSGSNEISMFDAINGSCAQCFRVVSGDRRIFNSHVDENPSLEVVDVVVDYRKSRVSPLQTSQEVGQVNFNDPINCMVGSIGASEQSHLVTGGSDGRIRFWDFSQPSKCYVVGEPSLFQHRPSFERIDFDPGRRLMLCRQTASVHRFHRDLFHGTKKPESFHVDSINDIKIIDNRALLSCSRDCSIKLWA